MYVCTIRVTKHKFECLFKVLQKGVHSSSLDRVVLNDTVHMHDNYGSCTVTVLPMVTTHIS